MARKSEPIAEHAARGEIERVYHEIRQVLRVRGVNLNFRTWATLGEFLPLTWDALRPNLETLAFEQAADQLRAEAVDAAAALGPLAALHEVALGQSQQFHIHHALLLYHYVNPKLLLLTEAVRMALEGRPISGGAESNPPRIERGIPPRMHAMEMVDEKTKDRRLRALFAQIRRTLELPSVNSDYRTLALWPDALEALWLRLRPLVKEPAYRESTDRLRARAGELAAALPLPFALEREELERRKVDVEQAVELTRHFSRLLPPLILNIALFSLEFEPAEKLRESPFPALAREAMR